MKGIFYQKKNTFKDRSTFMFNTQDLAFCDMETGLYFIVGRVPSIDKNGNLNHSLAKVNGKSMS